MARTSVSDGLQEIKSTYSLIQHKHGKNVSLRWLARNKIHVRADAAQARQELQSPMACKKSNLTYQLIQHKHGKNISLRWLARNQIHVHPDAAQAWQEPQSPMACKKSNPRTR
jgi:hypothetical protein